ncbi:unnamed protein product [Ectocarpus sp. 13 AM-2016]
MGLHKLRGSLLRAGRLEPELSANLGRVLASVSGDSDPGGDGALALRGHGLQRLLLAQRGPLPVLDQLPARGVSQEMVRRAGIDGR